MSNQPPEAETASTINLDVEFSAGIETLFNNQRRWPVSIPALPDGKPANLAFLIIWLKDNLLSKQKDAEMFVENGTIRPGIIVLVNDADWELHGEGDYVLQEKDEIIFISTLHGG